MKMRAWRKSHLASTTFCWLPPLRCPTLCAVERARTAGRSPPQALDPQDNLAGLAVPRRVEVLQLTSNHGADQLAKIAPRHGPLVDRFTVAQHGDAVGNLSQLLHAVGHENHRHAAGLELTDDAEQLVNLVARKRGGGLVHDDETSGADHGAGDLDQLSLGLAQSPHGRARIEVEAKPLE